MNWVWSVKVGDLVCYKNANGALNKECVGLIIKRRFALEYQWEVYWLLEEQRPLADWWYETRDLEVLSEV